MRCAALVADSGDRDVLCRRRRAHQAHRRGVRLARRGDAGQFPHRRLGHAAGLHRPAAADPAGPASRRAVAGARRRSGDRAGRLDPGGARHRPVRTRRRRQRRHRRGQARGAAAGAQGHRGAPLHHHRAPAPPPCSGVRRRRGLDASTPSRIAPPTIALAKEPEPQLRGSLLLNYKLEDDYGVVDAQATFERKPRTDKPHGRGQAAAPAVRRAQFHRWCCRRRAPAPAPARPPRICPSIPGPAST